MFSEEQKAKILKSDLSAISRGFERRDSQTDEWTAVFTPPALDEVERNYADDYAVKEKIGRMLDSGDALKKLYAAVLIWKIDRPAAETVLRGLTENQTGTRVQSKIGFRIIETTVGILARDFLAEQNLRGANFSREVQLDRWAAAARTAKKNNGEDFEAYSLPRLQDVLNALNDENATSELQTKIERLKNGIAAEKFYAAALLDLIDKTESQSVLESLLTDKTEVALASGDVVNSFPADVLARRMLDSETDKQTHPPSNLIARTSKWLDKKLFGDPAGE